MKYIILHPFPDLGSFMGCYGDYSDYVACDEDGNTIVFDSEEEAALYHEDNACSGAAIIEIPFE